MATSLWAWVTGGDKVAAERVEDPDYAFGERAMVALDLLARYFRVTIDGLENVPKGPLILVGNHNAGITFFDPMFLGSAWYKRMGGTDEFVYLVHDAMLALPGLGTFLRKMGAARAHPRIAEEALAVGRKIMVFPGGNYEAFRPYRDRHKIDMGNHKGFCKLAIKMQVPIVPVVGVGAHETFFVLARGARLAKWSGMAKFLRVESFPLILGLPWGLSLGPLFHIPLPAKISIYVGDPISIDSYRGASPDDKDAVDALYNLVTTRMQEMMDVAAKKRRRPILG